MIEIFIIAGALIFLLLVLYLLKRKRKKEKQWLLFREIKGYEDNPKKSYFAIHKHTGERREIENESR